MTTAPELSATRTRLLPQAPQVRCDECGSPSVSAVCHHCGRPLCGGHARARRSASGAALSREFARLDLAGEAPQHCTACDHLVRSTLRRPAAAGATTALVGVVLLVLLDTTVGAAVAGAGAIVAIGCLLVGDRRRRASVRPQLPLVPNLDSVRIIETLRGSVRLDPTGGYRASAEPVEGRLSLRLTLGRPDRLRLDRYRRQHRPAEDDDIEFSAGSIVLHGPAAVEFGSEGLPGPVIPLTGRVGELPFFADPDDLPAHRWPLTWSYRLTAPELATDFPLRIIPSLPPGSDQRSLELELQWTCLRAGDSPPDLDRIERLRIAVPVSWGIVEEATVGRDSDGWVTDSATMDDDLDEGGAPGPAFRVIEWSQLRMNDPRHGSEPEGGAAHRLRLTIRFERKVELTDSIWGDVDIFFRGAVSGVTGLRLAHPLGTVRRGGPRPQVATRVVTKFRLGLAGIRYQDLRVVPDRQRPEDTGRPEITAFPGVVPDHETVIDLTNALSDSGYYVKRVIENPPREGVHPSALNRDWDIAGRRYDGVYPIDFHIVLTGEETPDANGRPSGGHSVVRMTVQGTFANAEMEGAIAREWDQLHGLVSALMRARLAAAAGGSPTGQRNGSAPADDRADWLRRQRESLDDGVRRGWLAIDRYEDITKQLGAT